MTEPLILGTHAENTLTQLADVASRAEHSALMADGHLGYIMPVGGVAAYRNEISVNGVGYDIACGNCAIKTDLHAALFDRFELERLADEIQASISFGVGRTNCAEDAPVDHPLFLSPAWDALPQPAGEHLRDKARAQLGTVGSGNHYVDVFADEDGWLWVGVHFGSRGMGHTIASGFLALGSGEQWGARVPEKEILLDLDTPLGDAYFCLMSLAGEYAYAGREWVTRTVVRLLGGREVDLVHNHHNFAWHEEHFGEELVVVRKGATPAFPGQRGFVGGSMGDSAVILQGRAVSAVMEPSLADVQRRAMFSTVHGAGRVMSRTEAAGKTKRGPEKWHCRNRDCSFRGDRGGFFMAPDGPRPKCPTCGSKLDLRREMTKVREGKVSPAMMAEWLDDPLRGGGVILRGGGLDEAPQAYRRLPDVLAAQGPTVEILHTLKPLIVVMAASGEFDPYKD